MVYNYLVDLSSGHGDDGSIYTVYFKHKKKFTNKEFSKIIAQCVLNLSKTINIHKSTTGTYIRRIEDELIKFGFKPLEFEAQFSIPNISFGRLEKAYQSENVKIFTKIIQYEERDAEEEFDEKLKELKKSIDDIAWHAHNKDVNRAIKAIDCLIYGIERDLDD